MENQNLQPNPSENNASQPTVTESVSQTQNIPVNQSKPRRLKLIVLAALGIMLAVGLVFGGNYVLNSKTSKPTPTPTPDTTAGWKTFVSSNNKFSLQTPSTWSQKENQVQIGNVDCLYLKEGKLISVTACYRYEKFANSIFSKVPQRSSVKETTINSYVVYNDKNLLLNDYYILDPNGSFILITKGSDIKDDLYKKILSTFKFTDFSAGTGISGKIILSPTCGGPAYGAENCTKPYKAAVIVKNKNGKEITRFTSGDNGVFSVKLPAGIYILEPINKTANMYPIGKPEEVKVVDGKMTDVTLTYETGML